jgi:hypothetical protein
MSLKGLVNESKVGTRSKGRTSRYGHPREPKSIVGGTIMDDMVHILELLEENRRIKNGK